jgi:hypothetical protein
MVMQDESTTVTDKKEGTEEKAKVKKRLTLGRAHVAMLSVSATVLVFILAFSCYGCSYQPITPPTPEEAEVTFKGLYSSTWELDTTMGVTSLEELNNIAVLKFVIATKHAENESASTTMYLKDMPPVLVELVYTEGYGFSIESGGQKFAVKLLYSASKDGKSETLTMIGNESNIHCYYLKK